MGTEWSMPMGRTCSDVTPWEELTSHRQPELQAEAGLTFVRASPPPQGPTSGGIPPPLLPSPQISSLSSSFSGISYPSTPYTHPGVPLPSTGGFHPVSPLVCLTPYRNLFQPPFCVPSASPSYPGAPQTPYSGFGSLLLEPPLPHPLQVFLCPPTQVAYSLRAPSPWVLSPSPNPQKGSHPILPFPWDFPSFFLSHPSFPWGSPSPMTPEGPLGVFLSAHVGSVERSPPRSESPTPDPQFPGQATRQRVGYAAWLSPPLDEATPSSQPMAGGGVGTACNLREKAEVAARTVSV